MDSFINFFQLQIFYLFLYFSFISQRIQYKGLAGVGGGGFRGLGPGGVSLLWGATCRGSVVLGSVCLFKKTINPSWCILLVKDQFIHRRQLVHPNNYYLSTWTRKLAYHHCNSCTAQLLLVVQKMDYVIHWIEFSCNLHYPLDNILSGWIWHYPPLEQLVPAVNNNGTSHMEREVCVWGGYTLYSIVNNNGTISQVEREVCVLQVVTPCIVYNCMNPPFEHPLVSLKRISW